MAKLNSRQLQMLDIDNTRVGFTRKKPRPRGLQPTHAERVEALNEPSQEGWDLIIPDNDDSYRPEYG